MSGAQAGTRTRNPGGTWFSTMRVCLVPPPEHEGEAWWASVDWMGCGAHARVRTGDLLLTKEVLCQLSYVGMI